MQGRRVDRKRNAPTHRFAFSGWNTECLHLFGRNPQPSRTLCPTFFNSFSTCLPSLFLSTTISSQILPPSPGKPRRPRRPPSRPPPANPQSLSRALYIDPNQFPHTLTVSTADACSHRVSHVRYLTVLPFQMSQTREDSVYLAKLAEQAERYEGSSPRHFLAHSPRLMPFHRDGREHEARGFF